MFTVQQYNNGGQQQHRLYSVDGWGNWMGPTESVVFRTIAQEIFVCMRGVSRDRCIHIRDRYELLAFTNLNYQEKRSRNWN